MLLQADETAGRNIGVVFQPSVLPQLDIKLLFTVGSENDPAGKEGLAALTSSMIARGGSDDRTIDQIDAARYPLAATFTSQTDKEVTTFTGSVHKEHWQEFLAGMLAQLVSPGFREDDFKRLKTAQLNALTQDLRNNNEEELGKEELQLRIFRDSPYGHPVLGTVAGVNAITLDDVRQFAKTMYSRANVTIGVNGDAPSDLAPKLQAELSRLSATSPAVAAVRPRTLAGPEVEIVQKDTRATAISLGFPIDVKRGDPDFPALYLARTWLGEHRASNGQLFQRLREVRGLNYGDYAYIEAFPRGMFQFVPDPNIARRHQIFEIWIRPVVPENAHMSLRIALFELDKLVKNGLTRAQFEMTRDYLMSNVYTMTARQDQQLGYALDSRFYGIGEFTAYMRDALKTMTLEQVNAAIKRHLASPGMSVVIVTKDADALKQALVSDAPSAIKYDGEKPQALLDEDRIIGTMKLGLAPDRVTITRIEDVFAR
jgi:zinc protease